MAPKKITVTSKAAQTSASNSLNVRSITNSSLDVNIKTKSIAEIYVKMTPLPQQIVITLPISVESAEKSAFQKRSCHTPKLMASCWKKETKKLTNLDHLYLKPQMLE
ncbi:hypothetical protein JCGZ_19402 [Jatropha curcas]|uniref:Uncharacterized protein n=1 Tax=Jatropha curcas TaxID=180498 RepID=A0A067KBW3_JATCU|nr:hypothetical protein JCGZ_19402 [Jatropha curcas]